MGRIADALKRAELDRGVMTSPDEVAPASPGAERWSGWYGASSAVEEDSEPTVEMPAAEQVSKEFIREVSPEILALHDPESPISEQYRSLRTRLLAMNVHREHRVFVISSTAPGEGKSVTALNLAFSLAEIRHQKVLMVDGDLRRSSLAKRMNIDPEPGMADFLQGRASYEKMIRPTALSNLFIVPAGKASIRGAAELLSSRAARTAFKRFEKEYHYTIVDTPAAGMVADAEIIGQMASGVIMVVRAGRTETSAARRIVKQLASSNIPIVGSILVGLSGRSGGIGRSYPLVGNYVDQV